MNDIHPPNPVIETPLFSQADIVMFWVIIGVSLLILGLWFIIRYWRKYREKSLVVPPVIPQKIDHKKLALRQLAKLKALIDISDFTSFYLNISAIFKDYLSGKYDEHFSEMTTEEILRYMRNHQSSKLDIKDDISLIQDFLFIFDRANFTDYQSNSREADQILKRVVEFIKHHH